MFAIFHGHANTLMLVRLMREHDKFQVPVPLWSRHVILMGLIAFLWWRVIAPLVTKEVGPFLFGDLLKCGFYTWNGWSQRFFPINFHLKKIPWRDFQHKTFHITKGGRPWWAYQVIDPWCTLKQTRWINNRGNLHNVFFFYNYKLL